MGYKKEVYAKMQALYDYGMNDEEIQKETGCSALAVQKFRRSRGLSTQSKRKKNEKPNQALVKAAKAARASGLSYGQYMVMQEKGKKYDKRRDHDHAAGTRKMGKCNEWETPITMGVDLSAAADLIENQRRHIESLQKKTRRCTASGSP